MGRTQFFLVVMSLFVASLFSIASYYFFRGRKTSSESWTVLLGRLKQLDRDNIAMIALDRDFELNPARISRMIGGMQGLDALEANCVVLVDLAFYVQRWYPEAVALAEELRLNAREIQWHLGRLRGARSAQNRRANFPYYAQRAISVYYLMTRSILELYEHANLPGLADLQQKL